MQQPGGATGFHFAQMTRSQMRAQNGGLSNTLGPASRTNALHRFRNQPSVNYDIRS